MGRGSREGGRVGGSYHSTSSHVVCVLVYRAPFTGQPARSARATGKTMNPTYRRHESATACKACDVLGRLGSHMAEKKKKN